MRNAIRVVLGLAVVMALATAGLAQSPAVSPAVSPADRAAIERIIADQIEAFRRDDEATAFAYASPGIQATFQTPAIFMEMVRAGYQPVYRPRTVQFRDIVIRPWGPEQRVFVIGPDGKPYVAVYPMERQPDGSWRINGCYLEEQHAA